MHLHSLHSSFYEIGPLCSRSNLARRTTCFCFLGFFLPNAPESQQRLLLEGDLPMLVNPHMGLFLEWLTTTYTSQAGNARS